MCYYTIYNTLKFNQRLSIYVLIKIMLIVIGLSHNGIILEIIERLDLKMRV